MSLPPKEGSRARSRKNVLASPAPNMDQITERVRSAGDGADILGRVFITVGPHEYEARLMRGFPEDPLGRRCLGLVDTNRQIIQIAGVLHPTKRLSTLWHEITHAWIDELGGGNSKSYGEERICDLIGLGMGFIGTDKFAEILALVELDVPDTEGGAS